MSLEDRTKQKLRFARVHLDELMGSENRGHGTDYERAHHEAFLAQLFGSYYAFLQELNVCLGCGLPPEGVSVGKMRQSMKAGEKAHSVLTQLYELDQEPSGWFRLAKEFRDISMHVSGIPLSFYAGGKNDGKLALKHPQSLAELPDDVSITFANWLASMEQLIDRLRQEACTKNTA
jgi:hypothetical protein